MFITQQPLRILVTLVLLMLSHAAFAERQTYRDPMGRETGWSVTSGNNALPHHHTEQEVDTLFHQQRPPATAALLRLHGRANCADDLLGNVIGSNVTLAVLYTFMLWPFVIYIQSNLMAARLHDTDRSAWWQLVFWVPFAVFTVLEITVGKLDTSNMALHVLDAACRLIALVAAITIWVRRGTKGPNQYGDDPIPPGEEEIKAFPPLHLLKRNREEAH